MKPNKRVICKDGVSLSVQADKFAYCTPKENDAAIYTHVEVGYIFADNRLFPARTPRGWKKYQDGRGSAVYAYVPAALLLAFIKKHGGMIDGELPPLG